MNPVASTVTIVGCFQAGIGTCSENQLNDGLIAWLGRRLQHHVGWQLSRLLLLCMLGIVVFGGCCRVPGGRLRDWWCNGFKVGPNYSQPPAPVASEWIDYANPRVKSEEQQLGAWWTVFNDPTLNTLIQSAYQQNLTLRVAGARILEARAQLGIAQGNLFPQSQSAFADYARVKLSRTPPTRPYRRGFPIGMLA